MSGHLPNKPGNSGHKTLTLAELESNYEIIDVNAQNGVIYASEKGVTSTKLAVPGPGSPFADESSEVDAAGIVAQGEISGSGETLWRRTRLVDYNPGLTGTQAIDTYKEMKNDSIVRSTLHIAKTPILSARWFMEPASQEPEDVYRAEFVWKNLTQWMTSSWPQFLTDSLHMLDYGVQVFEKVFDILIVPGPTGTPEPRVVWRKFAPRSTYEISEFIYDEEGGPEAVKILTNDGEVDLEIAKALIFTYDKEAGDLWGVSILRSAYKHWFFKEQLYKIDAIQKERHGIGIPVIKLPPNFTINDRVVAENIGGNLRTNERAHVVLPPGWEVMFLKLEGQHVDALESAQHHADKLYENVLANFMVNSATASSESQQQEQMFTRAVRFTAEIIRDVLNQYAIKQLIDFNWPEEELENGYPQLKVRRLGDERDWRVISFAIRNLVGAGVIRPDDTTEAWIRDELDMPVADTATARQIVKEVGMEDDVDGDEDGNIESDGEAGSRQSRSNNNRQAQTPGNSRGDNSGTSGTND